MKAYEVYRQIRSKADEVKEAIHAVLTVRGSKDRWTADDLIDYFRIYSCLAAEAEIQKDGRRHVRVLFEDYCKLRDELLKLLQTDMSTTSQVKPLKIELELPDGDPRSAKVQWSEMEGDTLHVCISVTDRAAQK